MLLGYGGSGLPKNQVYFLGDPCNKDNGNSGAYVGVPLLRETAFCRYVYIYRERAREIGRQRVT